ncbi:Endonuclease/Exonuclease/phosphatase family protein [Tritrichomonas foetus]|uniref:Endonuclease/Exonuclease/phosphatase family protein n=1 Tax=Tritrichomonas foetus TaxID=1144522 RepID=A0A1J4K4B6_9EUKA|nr:Endonuclease/Exonuclease/phosphatase family protein [Tritrichomonas foetus]|eukprot:OHT05680.1 Endonuclease/Exonuclease/phosphatase family protein [Tritrichomonas foetus]
MENFLQKECGKWLEYEAALNTIDNKIFVGISLQNNSLAKAYLYFRKNNTYLACFPINCFLKCEINELSIVLDFFTYSDESIDVICKDDHICRVICSQIAICTHISKLNTEIFQAENRNFLTKFSQRKYRITNQPISLPFFPLEATGEARKTWIARTDEINKPYYTKLATLPMLIYTWNIAQHPPEEDTFESAKHIFQTEAMFIAFVLQEIDFSAKAVILGISQQRVNWNETIDKAAEGTNYETVLEDSLGGIFVKYMVKKNMPFKVKTLTNKLIRLGANGLAANKSAIITEFDIGGTAFCFIGCHLTPHNPNYEQRNLQMIELLENIDSLEREADYAIIYGDLNYRVDIPYEETVDKCQQNEIEPLLESDQLLRFLHDEPRYKDFHEEKITFLPTYKFDDKCNIYDTSKKHRIPSWTDRIIFRVGKRNQVVGPSDTLIFETDVLRHINLPLQFSGPSYFSIDDPPLNYPRQPVYMHYKSYPDILFSDHRPVEILAKFPIPVVDQNRLKAFKIIQNKRFDEIVGLKIPRCKAEPTSFETEGESEIKLINVSCSTAKWKIGFVPPNVTVVPESGEVPPEKEMMIKLKCTPEAEKQFVTLNLEGGSPVTFEFWKKKEE